MTSCLWTLLVVAVSVSSGASHEVAGSSVRHEDASEERQRWSGPTLCRPTSPDVLGPYYFPYPPARQQLCTQAPGLETLPTLLVVGRVRGDDCTPLEGARLEVWQADHGGHYIMRENCRGYITSRLSGYYSFMTIHPGKYKVGGEFRPAHIHFRVTHKGYNILVTQMYFSGDSNLGSNDSCTACQSRKPDLVVAPYKICPDESDKFCFNMVHFDVTLRRGDAADVVPDVDETEDSLRDIVKEGR